MTDTRTDELTVLDYLAKHAGPGSARKEALDAFSAASRLTARSTAAEAMCDRLADKLAESGCPPVGEYACPVDDCGAEDYIRPACWREWARN